MPREVPVPIPPLTCSVRVPHATWTSLDIGEISILFSFGQPVGLSMGETTLIRGAVRKATRKHLNNWRDFRQHSEVAPDVFDTWLLDRIRSEVEFLKVRLTNSLEQKQMAQQDDELESQLNNLNDPAINEVEDLDDEIDEDEDEDDSPYDDSDDDDDLEDDEDEDDDAEDLDEDDLDDDFDDAEGEDDDENLKENEF